MSDETTITITLFKSVYQSHVPQSQVKTITWKEFANDIATERLVAKKKESLPLIGTFTLKDLHRVDSNVEKIFAIILDYDNKLEITRPEEFSDFPFAYVLYTTHSHTTEAPRFRVIIPLTRPITKEELPTALAGILCYAPMRGLDPGVLMPSRCYYVPAINPMYEDPDEAFIERFSAKVN